jgi:V/A-type H+-transporting ATPase subunit D
MAVKFQYNKTSLNEIGKQLKVRQKALPTLQNKESALRLEVRKAKADSERLLSELEDALQRYDYLAALWNEFEPGLIAITDVDLYTKKVAGVKTPALGEIHYEIKPFNAFVKPAWYADGVSILKELSRLGIESEVYLEKARILDYQRKKTTQKVNLYEKVQIPGYREAIRKIKRYMEDEENLSKSSQKILKSLQEKRRKADALLADDDDEEGKEDEV